MVQGMLEYDEAQNCMFRTLPDGRILGLIPLTFGRVRLTVGLDKMTWEEGW